MNKTLVETIEKTSLPGAMQEKFTFPKDFIWGTSISATQTEGGNDNDWTDVVAKDGKKVGNACDHYNRYKEDFALVAAMNNNCIRIGVEWSRLQKAAYEELDAKEVEHYRNYLGEAISLGLKPMVVLHHFANPIWFSSKGGWLKRQSSEVFVDYAKKAIKEFSDLADTWNTFNEPNFFVTNSYLYGIFPPFKHSPVATYKVRENLQKAHNEVYNYAKTVNNNLVAATSGWRPNWGDNCIDSKAAEVVGHMSNEWFTDGLMEHSDFFGLSYYGDTFFRRLMPMLPMHGVKKEKIESRGLRCDDFNLLTPERLAPTLEYVAERYNKPIIITENGFATEDGKLREEMIVRHVQEVGKAIKSGLDIRGYIHWSLMDNFEWNHGYTKCFGLYGVDFKGGTLERIKRTGVDKYAEICKSNSIDL